MHICSRQAVSTEKLTVSRGIDTQILLPQGSILLFILPREGDFEKIPSWKENGRLYLLLSKLGLDARWRLHSNPDVWFLL